MGVGKLADLILGAILQEQAGDGAGRIRLEAPLVQSADRLRVGRVVSSGEDFIVRIATGVGLPVRVRGKGAGGRAVAGQHDCRDQA